MDYYGVILLAAVLGSVESYPTVDKDHSNQLSSEENNGVENGLESFFKEGTFIDKHPNLAQILVNGDFSCAGVILSKNWILADADCTDDIADLTELTVSTFNTTDIDNYYEVKSVFTHPQYSVDSFTYDYALVEVRGALSWTCHETPVQRPPTGKKTVRGWRDTGDIGEPFVHRGVLYGVALEFGVKTGHCGGKVWPIMASAYRVVDWVRSVTGAHVAED